MDNAATQPAPELMSVEPGSPTELADGSDLGDPFDVDEDNNPMNKKKEKELIKPKQEKRKRERRTCPDGAAAARAVPSDDENGELESPSKRPSCAEDRALSAKDIRELLMGHVSEMRNAWSAFEGRLDKVEQAQSRSSNEIADLQARTGVVEKDLQFQRATFQTTTANLEQLTTEVKNMKVRMEEIGSRPAPPVASPGPSAAPATSGGQPDPWADFLRQRGRQVGGNDAGARGQANITVEGDKMDTLSEDERRTLVIGGWLQDTRRSVIEEEAGVIFQTAEFKEILDSEKLAIYGPRRSVGMLKFIRREGETENDMRNRMWQIIRALSQMKLVLPSTKGVGSDKVLWASFVKTRSARLRSSRVSMIRRVCIALAVEAEAKNAGGVTMNTQGSAYDCDWNMGTIWCGPYKLGSSSHRSPKDEETVTMSGGWISLTAVAKIAACSTDEAKLAFEKEL